MEQRRIPWPGRAFAIVPLASRLPGRAQSGAEGDAGQQHEFVPVPYDIELFEDVPEGVEPGEGDCGD